MVNGEVLIVKEKHALVYGGKKYYIIENKDDGYKVGEQASFSPEDALQMPSYLFAIAALEEDNLDSTLDFIHSKWFRR